MNLRKIYALMGLAVLLSGSSVAMAEEAVSGAAHADPYKSLAAAFAIGIAALGGALGQGRTATAALEAIGRNPASADKVQTPMIIGLALIESLVIYAFIIAFRLA